MNIYKTHKTSRVATSTLACVPIAFGLFLIISTLVAYYGGTSAIVFNLTALGFLFLYFGYLLLKSSFVTVTLNHDELRVKMLFTPVKIYKLKELKEVVLYQLRPINEITLHELSGVAETYGRSISKSFLTIIANASKNADTNKLLILKKQDDTYIFLNTNYMNDSRDLINEIISISGLKPTCLGRGEFRAWKNGGLEEFRGKTTKYGNYPKTEKLLAKIKPYFRLKYLVYPFLMVSAILVLVANIWFNIIHYDFVNSRVDNFKNDMFDIKLKVDRGSNYKDYKADIYLKNTGTILLDDMPIAEENLSETTYHYSLYPFDNPYYYPKLLNLDYDAEPEIILNRFAVYDFDVLKNKFIVKELKDFSKDFDRYIVELRGYSGDKWSVIVQNILGVFVAYLFLLLILFIIVKIMKGLSKKE